MATQRAGRAGRIAPGEFYALYTKETFDFMQVDQYPDIVKDDITLNLLSMIIRAEPKSEDDDNELVNTPLNLAALDLLDRPSADSMHNSINKLFALGAIDVNCCPTPVGRIMNKFRFVGIEMIRTILAGYAHGCSICDLINMAAMITIGKYVTKITLLPQFAKHFMTAPVLDTVDDFITTIFAFDAMATEITELTTATSMKKDRDSHKSGGRECPYIVFDDLFRTLVQGGDIGDDSVVGGADTAAKLLKWADDRAISLKTMRDIMDLREDIINMLVNNGFDPYKNYDKSLHLISRLDIHRDKADMVKVLAIKRAIFEGHKLNIATFDKASRQYLSRSTHVPFIPANSALVRAAGLLDNEPPHYIIYDSLDCMPDRSGNYVITAGHVSVLDGFIDVDVGFDGLI
jgi:HrpA-like RNA helicase